MIISIYFYFNTVNNNYYIFNKKDILNDINAITITFCFKKYRFNFNNKLKLKNKNIKKMSLIVYYIINNLFLFILIFNFKLMLIILSFFKK